MAHLLGRRNLQNFTVDRWTQRGLAGDQDDAGTAARRRFGQRIAHLAAGAIAEEAHRIDCFPRAAGRDQDSFAGKVMAIVQLLEHRLHDGLRIGQPAGAYHATSQVTIGRRDDAHATIFERRHIGAGGSMLPHIHVHGRSHNDGCRGR